MTDDSNNGRRRSTRKEKFRANFQATSEGFVLSNRGDGPPIIVLLLWLTPWTFACIRLTAMAWNHPIPILLPIPVLFWSAWVWVAGWLVWAVFGREVLSLNDNEALFTRQAIITLSTRRVARIEILRFRECRSEYKRRNRYFFGIEVATKAEPIRFAFNLTNQERQWLVHQMNRCVAGAEKLAARSNGELSPGNTLAERPSDSWWAFTSGTNRELVLQGRFNRWRALGLLVISCIWNGGVFYFIQLLYGSAETPNLTQNDFRAPPAILVGAVFIGLLMFFLLLSNLVSSFRKTIWRFERHRITKRNVWPIFTRTKDWEFDRIHRLELRDISDGTPNISNGDKPAIEVDKWGLVFKGNNNVDICILDDVTRSEALWIANVLSSRRKS